MKKIFIVASISVCFFSACIFSSQSGQSSNRAVPDSVNNNLDTSTKNTTQTVSPHVSGMNVDTSKPTLDTMSVK